MISSSKPALVWLPPPPPRSSPRLSRNQPPRSLSLRHIAHRNAGDLNPPLLKTRDQPPRHGSTHRPPAKEGDAEARAGIRRAHTPSVAEGSRRAAPAALVRLRRWVRSARRDANPVLLIDEDVAIRRCAVARHPIRRAELGGDAAIPSLAGDKRHTSTSRRAVASYDIASHA